MTPKNEDLKNRDANPDLITGEPGSHPIGTGLGAAGAGAAGAAIGSVVGPVGTIVGAVVGAVAGGLAGKGVAEMVDPTGEDNYWRAQHAKEPYAAGSDDSYDDYAPAYRAGYEGRDRVEAGTLFDDAEPTLRSDYDARPGAAKLPWDKAKDAARRAWDRVDRGESVRMKKSPDSAL